MAAVRRHWRIPVVCLLLAAVIGGAYYARGRHAKKPPHYVASANVSIPSNDPQSKNRSQNAVVPDVLLRNQAGLAVDPATLAAARQAAGLPTTGDDGLSFAAHKSDTGDTITLTVNGKKQQPVAAVISKWVDAYINARSQSVAESNKNRQDTLVGSIRTLRRRVDSIEAELKLQMPTLPPVIYPWNVRNNGSSSASSASSGSVSGSAAAGFVPNIAIPPGTPLDTENLLYERNALYVHIAEAQAANAESAITATDANPYATVLDISGAEPKGGSAASSPLIPAGGIVVVGLVLGLGLAVMRDRLDRSIRDGRTAGRALHAPVLATISPSQRSHGEYTVLEHPTTERSLAFRVLAATSVATDRLPRAILVSSPRGDAQDEVAANFAAALAAIGLRVALVGTSPRQRWFAQRFREPEPGLATFAELLALAHAGSLNGHVERHVAAVYPNLVVIPPGDGYDLNLRLDGFPVLLEALRRAEVDITVIAGPAVLEDANATIMAWATRSVLWAVQIGQVTEADATAASTRLELAGVQPFGVAVIAPED